MCACRVKSVVCVPAFTSAIKQIKKKKSPFLFPPPYYCHLSLRPVSSKYIHINVRDCCSPSGWLVIVSWAALGGKSGKGSAHFFLCFVFYLFLLLRVKKKKKTRSEQVEDSFFESEEQE